MTNKPTRAEVEADRDEALAWVTSLQADVKAAKAVSERQLSIITDQSGQLKELGAKHETQRKTIQSYMAEANGNEIQKDKLAKRNHELEDEKFVLKREIRASKALVATMDLKLQNDQKLCNQVRVLKRIIHKADICPLLAIDTIFEDGETYFAGTGL